MKEALGLARENGSGEADLEQLPAYEEASGGGQMQIQRPTPIAPNGTQRPRPAAAPPAINGVVGLGHQSGVGGGQSSREKPPPPDEPPPGYEEVQQSSVADQLERSLRKES